jgi:hypothetical protein
VAVEREYLAASVAAELLQERLDLRDAGGIESLLADRYAESSPAPPFHLRSSP